ncbi:hypothetical protein EUGRSUZ_L03234 [Eucalyptus grandis]|uniref:Uncharacterized protein n=1 Tax=Eucalyptus grandis TaxID=71139 RepID=A0AAD9T8B7_EUCGR|nr:hypothetical protein EUGRSUZ_L03234 [Eucalyptus grandis]
MIFDQKLNRPTREPKDQTLSTSTNKTTGAFSIGYSHAHDMNNKTWMRMQSNSRNDKSQAYTGCPIYF